jgi:hypothetical protein
VLRCFRRYQYRNCSFDKNEQSDVTKSRIDDHRGNSNDLYRSYVYGSCVPTCQRASILLTEVQKLLSMYLLVQPGREMLPSWDIRILQQATIEVLTLPLFFSETHCSPWVRYPGVANTKRDYCNMDQALENMITMLAGFTPVCWDAASVFIRCFQVHPCHLLRLRTALRAQMFKVVPPHLARTL